MTGLGVRENRKGKRKGRNEDGREGKRKRCDLWKMKFPSVNEMATKEGKESQSTCIWSRKG